MVVNQGKIKIFELMKTIFNVSIAFDTNISSKTIDRHSIHFNGNRIQQTSVVDIEKDGKGNVFKKIILYTEFCVIY